MYEVSDKLGVKNSLNRGMSYSNHVTLIGMVRSECNKMIVKNILIYACHNLISHFGQGI